MVTPTLLGAYHSMKDYLKQVPKLPGCAFADNDTIAIGVIKALRESGYQIPEDISIIGVDDIPFSAIHSPSISTMSIPKKLMGKLAIEYLKKTVEDNTFTNTKTRVGGSLITRHSTRHK